MYITKCVRYSRFFLNRLLQNLRDNASKKFITISPEPRRDITWFDKFVDTFNGKSIFVKNNVDREIHLDACPKGVGAIFKNFIYQERFPSNMAQCNIAAWKW